MTAPDELRACDERPRVPIRCDSCGASMGTYRLMPEDVDMTGFDDDWTVSTMACNRCEDGRGEIVRIAAAGTEAKEER